MANLYDQVVDALRTVYDPEIPVNIWDLGLIYDLDIDPEAGRVGVRMTLTAPGCPVAGFILDQVEQAILRVEAIHKVGVELVFDPPWSTELMSEAARLELGLF